MANSEVVKDKISYLRTSVICANSSSLNDCLELVQLRDIEHSHLIDAAIKEDSALVCSLPVTGYPVVTSTFLALQKSSMQVISEKLAPRKYVNDALDFYQHMQAHKKRVVEMGMRLLKEFPDEFKGLDENILKSVLSVHDNAKVRTTSRYNGRPFYEVLYNEGYGKKLDRKIVDALNNQDEKFVKEVFDQFNLNDSTREKILRIEKIADFVDRGMSPVATEEFGRKTTLASQSDFFLKDKMDRNLAKYLEDNYQDINKDLHYKKLSVLEKAKLKSRLDVKLKYGELVNEKKAGVFAISRAALASQIKSHAKSLGSRIAGLLSNTKFIKGVTGVDLMLTSIKTGCQEIGYHDWVQDPNCGPLIGLGPNVIKFLDEPWLRQEMALQHGQHMCSVVDGIYNDLQSNRVNRKSCLRDGKVKLNGLDKRNILVTSEDNKIDKVQFYERKYGRMGVTIPVLSNLEFDPNGEIEKACFSVQNGTKNLCKNKYEIKSNSLNNVYRNAISKAQEYLKKNSFDIARSISCCLRETQDPSLKAFCAN
ncbi:MULTISPECIES: hypothetical protein [unclassified Halobacteriovorax]|uniref:hypothetical protein n=1 Tax=unclassified Halobacteriovorax TaxID=2639665 RepID=UPI003999F833